MRYIVEFQEPSGRKLKPFALGGGLISNISILYQAFQFIITLPPPNLIFFEKYFLIFQFYFCTKTIMSAPTITVERKLSRPVGELSL